MKDLETLKFFRAIGIPAATLDITLLDVGVSGGIHQDWRCFEPDFSAIGIDVIENEVERLQQAEENDRVTYQAAYVGWPDWKNVFPEAIRTRNHTGNFDRTSAVLDKETHKERFATEVYNRGDKPRYAERHTTIDELAQMHPSKGFDVIKTDTDGFDYPVLMGGEATLLQNRTLAVEVEVNFHCTDHPYANGFANIDTFMRRKGFTLMHLETYQYSRRALPQRYIYDITAQTETGFVQWGDALYVRDFCNPRFSRMASWEPRADHIIRMAMLFEFYGQADSVVELLEHFKDALDFRDQLETLYDRLVQRYRDPELGQTYQELIGNFREDYRRFFPRRS